MVCAVIGQVDANSAESSKLIRVQPTEAMSKWLLSRISFISSEALLYHVLPEDCEDGGSDDSTRPKESLEKCQSGSQNMEKAAVTALVLSLCAFLVSSILRILPQWLSATDSACVSTMSAYSQS